MIFIEFKSTPLHLHGRAIDLFMIDPPWPKQKGGLRKSRPNQDRLLDYSTMAVKDIFELLDSSVFPLADPSHNVFMWTIDAFLHDAEREMDHRGYRRHARFIWNKLNGVAPAFTVRYTHEYLLWYYKPPMRPIASKMRGVLPTVFEEKSRQHSRKPDTAYQMVEALYPEARKIDVFSRESRPGWEQFGDQLNYFGERK